MCGLCAGHGCSNHGTSEDARDGEYDTSGSDEDELDAAPVQKRRRHFTLLPCPIKSRPTSGDSHDRLPPGVPISS